MKPETILRPEPGPLSAGVLVMPDSNAFSLAACVDPMRAANRQAGRALFSWTFLSPQGGPVPLTAGFDIATAPLPDQADFDMLILVAGFRLEEQVTADLLARLRRLSPRLRAMIGVDGGAWFLGRAGLLDGHSATTHWEDLETFAARFPDIDVRRDRYVISGRMMTTGGASPCLDLMLHLIGTRHGAELALRVAGSFIYEPIQDARAPQHSLSSGHIAKSDPALGQAIRIMEDHIEQPLPVAAIAAEIGLSQRRLEMLFAERLGKSPGRFFLDLRLDAARRMVVESRIALQEIALRSGFSSQMAFARAFRARFGQTASSLRAP